MINKIALGIPGDRTLEGVGGMPEGGVGMLQRIIKVGFTALFVAITVASLIFFIWGGIQWITSSGDKAKIESARKRIVFSVVGLVVAFSAYFIINVLESFFGLNIIRTR